MNCTGASHALRGRPILWVRVLWVLVLWAGICLAGLGGCDDEKDKKPSRQQSHPPTDSDDTDKRAQAPQAEDPDEDELEEEPGAGEADDYPTERARLEHLCFQGDTEACDRLGH